MPTLSDIYASTVLAAGIPGRITAGGPGSGRHPGFGSFTKAKSKKVGQTQWTRYSAPSATGLAQPHVDVHHAGHQVKIYEGMGGKFGSSSQGKYFGDRTGAKELLSKTYGISHKFKASALEAGGPGSGRHKQILEQYGWKDNGVGDFRHAQHPGHGISIGRNGQSWEHGGQGGSIVNMGRNADSLSQHLSNFHSKKLEAGGKGSGCRGENCGRHGGGKGTDKTHVPKSATVGKASSQALVKQYGWKKTREDKTDVYYKHPKQKGVINIEKSSGDFQHKLGGSVMSDGTLRDLQEHLSDLHEGK